MPYALSFLDKSPVDGTESAADALARTVKLAQKAEEAGFRRYWLAEHHNASSLAGSSPEVLIGFLLAQTKSIRIGSGGVMLQHYSAYKVAENFNLLASLAPGRVDLGIGKAPGGLPLSTKALQGAYDPAKKPNFEEQLNELEAFINSSPAQTENVDHLAAYPTPPKPPQRFLLGASVESAVLAAKLNWDYVFAGHIQGDENVIDAALLAYRNAAGRPALLAINVVTAPTESLAEELTADARRFRVEVAGAQAVNVGTRDQALEYVRQTGATDYKIEERKARVVRGTPTQVHRELKQLHQKYGVEEFVIESPLSDGSHRLATIELLADARPAIAA